MLMVVLECGPTNLYYVYVANPQLTSNYLILTGNFC